MPKPTPAQQGLFAIMMYGGMLMNLCGILYNFYTGEPYGFILCGIGAVLTFSGYFISRAIWKRK